MIERGFSNGTTGESGITCVYPAGRHVRRRPVGQQYAVLPAGAVLPRGAVLLQNVALLQGAAAQQNVAVLDAVLHQHVAAV